MRRLVIAAAAALVLPGCALLVPEVPRAPIVDMQGVEPARFGSDMADCYAYAERRHGPAEGALGGALVGAALMAIVAPSGSRTDWARAGAGVGALGGAGEAVMSREAIVRNCLVGRGYRVLG